MDTDIQKYIETATDEVLNPKFATTKQYLEVGEIEFEDGKPKIERVDNNYLDDLVAVYFPFKDGLYFLQVNVTKEPEIKVDFVYTENANKTYFTATSEELSFDELSQGLSLKPLTGWSKSDYNKNGTRQYKFSRVSYEPFQSDAYDFEKQLDLLLTELEKDAKGVLQLSEKAIAYISVRKYQYVSGNAGIHFDIQTIKRLSKLNLSVDIDAYIIGNQIKDDDD